MVLPRQGASFLLLALSFLPGVLLGQDRGLRLEGLREGQFREAELGSGSTVIVFWASWSPKCRDIVERVNSLTGRLGRGTRLITVDFQEEPVEVERFLKGKTFSVPVYLDRTGAFAKKYGVTTLPSLLIFRDGKEAYRGSLPADAERLIREKLSG